MIEIDADRLSRIQRINVIGTSGSGKSTFGRQLAEILAFPLIEMDRVYWGPNWKEPADEEFIPKIEKLTERSRWVLDGNYSRTTFVKWRHVQLVVWLDMSFLGTVFRVSARSVRRSLDNAELWPGIGNRETLRKAFLSRESVILWAITSYKRNRQRYSKIMKSSEYQHVQFVRLRSLNEVQSFLRVAQTAAEQSKRV